MAKKLFQMFCKIRKFFLKKNILMKEYFEQWCVQRESEKEIKLKTLENYRRQIYMHLLPTFGDVFINDITQEKVQEFVRILETDKKLKAGTVRNIFGLLSAILQKAVNDGYIRMNPCCAVVLPKGRQREGKALTSLEVTKLEKVIEDCTAKNTAIKLALYSGLRISEITALRWKNIDLMSGFIQVQNSFQRVSKENDPHKKTVVTLGTPKSEKSIRSIPMSDIMYESLINLYAEVSEVQKQGDSYVVSKKDGSFYDVRTVQKHFKLKIEEANIENYHFHDLRHTFATMAKENGMDIKMISELLGHTRTETTMNIYVHLSNQAKKEAMQKMNRLNIDEKNLKDEYIQILMKALNQMAS